ncbi:unnamed protein product [[Candida] boidinii]|uniref:Unnamed protein product n=1 Tax=Candida boidinii TaxID=5477 RepID=A0ACB5TW95_CANBO|nr:unnamed protein product [[Candida] boidinii]
MNPSSPPVLSETIYIYSISTLSTVVVPSAAAPGPSGSDTLRIPPFSSSVTYSRISLDSSISSEAVATHVDTATDVITETETVSCSASETPVSVSETPVSVSETPVSVSETPVSVSETSVSVSEIPVSVSETSVSVSETPVAATSAMETKDEDITFTSVLTIQMTEKPTTGQEENTLITSASKSSSVSLSSGTSESTLIPTEYTDGSLGRQVCGIFKSFSVIVCVMLFI